jgi:alanine racemase
VNFQDELNRIALENGVQYFGVADLSEATNFIVDQGGSDYQDILTPSQLE